MSVCRKKGFWTWSEKKLIFRKMRGDIWRGNILQGVEIIELYLWLKKSAIGWIFWPQTAFE